MKKILLFTLVALLLAGCGATTVKTGLGNKVSIASSTDATADKAGLAQVDTTMAAVTFDSKGKILNLTIDTAQTKVNFSKEGKITTDKAAEQKTKVELGNDYGMKKASKLGKEWFEEIADLQKWMIGKTIDQVKSMKVKEVEGKKVTDEADLTSKVSIGVEDYLYVVEEAFKNAK